MITIIFQEIIIPIESLSNQDISEILNVIQSCFMIKATDFLEKSVA